MKKPDMTAVVLGLALLSFIPARGAPDDGAADPGEEAKDCLVFVGIASAVEVDGQVGVLGEVTKDKAEVVVDGRRIVSSNRRIHFANTKLAPKVATFELTVREIESHTWITPAIDPRLQAMSDANRLMMEAADGEGRSRANQMSTQENNEKVRAGLEAEDKRVSPADFRDETPYRMEQQMNMALLSSSLVSDQASGLKTAGEVPVDRFTTTFEVSSEREMSDLYAIGLLVIRTVEAPDKPTYTMLLKPIPAVGPKPKRMSIDFFGLPAGFAVDRFELHLFSDGVELATNLSKGRVAVTRKDAFDLLLAQYLVERPDVRLPPAAVRELLRREPALTGDQAGRYAKIKVNREGRVTGVALAAVGDRSEDERLEAFVKDTLFYPALVDGEQVDGELEITLGELTL